MLIPDVFLTPLVLTLRDMGADIQTTETEVPGHPLFRGVFNGKFVVGYREGVFVQIHCNHEPTLQNMRQIVSLLLKEEK